MGAKDVNTEEDQVCLKCIKGSRDTMHSWFKETSDTCQVTFLRGKVTSLEWTPGNGVQERLGLRNPCTLSWYGIGTHCHILLDQKKLQGFQ